MTTTQGDEGRSASVPAAPAGRSREGMPSGTPKQLEVFDAIVARQVHGYPGWSSPEMFWEPNKLQTLDVTARCNRFLGAGLVAWEPSWCPPAMSALDRQARYLLLPTVVGEEWRERCAVRERRAAIRRGSVAS